MNDFLRELCAWLSRNPFGRKILFCRSTATGNQLLRMAASQGVAVVNALAIPVQAYINQLAEPVLIEKGLQRIDHVTASIALRDIMERAGDAFTTLGVVELTTAESVLPQLDELERNGIAPDQLESVNQPLLASVWRDYMRWMHDNGYASMAEILASASLPDGASFAILSNLQLSQMEQRFLQSIPADRLTVIIDYKTGRAHRFKSDFDNKLQYYLYTLAWEKLHPLQPIERASMTFWTALAASSR